MSSTQQWRPAPGQIALIEPVGAKPPRDCLTGVVVPGERLLVDLGASPRPETEVSDVVASFFAPEALYRLSGTATLDGGGLLTLDVESVEKVQRRTAPRVRVALPVRMTTLADPPSASLVTGRTIDLSIGGCMVTTEHPWPDELDPMLAIDLPDGGALVTQARVVTVDLTGDGWEYRLAYPTLGAADRERISRLVALES